MWNSGAKRLTFFQDLFMYLPSLKFSKAAKLFVISIWYCFLISSSFSFLRLSHFTSNFCAACLFTANLSLSFETTRKWSVSQLVPLQLRTYSIFDFHLLSISMWSIWLCVFPSGDVQVHLWMFWCGNIVLLTTGFFWCGEVYYSNTSLLSWCRLSFSIACLKIFSLPTFAFKSPNRIIIQ